MQHKSGTALIWRDSAALHESLSLFFFFPFKKEGNDQALPR